MNKMRLYRCYYTSGDGEFEYYSKDLTNSRYYLLSKNIKQNCYHYNIYCIGKQKIKEYIKENEYKLITIFDKEFMK